MSLGNSFNGKDGGNRDTQIHIVSCKHYVKNFILFLHMYVITPRSKKRDTPLLNNDSWRKFTKYVPKLGPQKVRAAITWSIMTCRAFGYGVRPPLVIGIVLNDSSKNYRECSIDGRHCNKQNEIIRNQNRHY